MRPAALVVVVLALSGAAAGSSAAPADAATPRKRAAKPKAPAVVRHACYERLDELGVDWKPARPRKGIKLPVEVTGALGGVTYATWGPRALILDCSLVYSLALAGGYFVEAGITRATYSSAYERRNVRRTKRPSNHSYGLALDVHAVSGPHAGKLELDDDFEQGLGDGADCVGDPLTTGGWVLKLLHCRLERSGLFRIVLSPDYDQDHHNHFHVEALPWATRPDREDKGRIERERARRRTTRASDGASSKMPPSSSTSSSSLP